MLAENLDRFSRDQEQIAAFYKQATFAGVQIVTLAEGEINELHIGLKGTVGALYSRTSPTRAAAVSRVGSGKVAPLAMYRMVIKSFTGSMTGGTLIGASEPIESYAGGSSPLCIARALNREGMPGPAGGLGFDPSIRDRPGRDDGILHNEIYKIAVLGDRPRGRSPPAVTVLSMFASSVKNASGGKAP